MMTSVHPHDDVRIFVKEAKTLHQAGYSVTILCSNFEGIKDGIVFVKQELSPKRWQRVLTSSRKFFKRALSLDCDIYHIHDPELLPAAFKLKKKGKIVVYDSHEKTPTQILTKPYSCKPYRHIMSEYIKRVEKKADKKLDLIISATPIIAEQFKNTIVVCNYPLVEEIDKIPYIPYKNREKQVCYCGSITENRGIQPMMEASESSGVTLMLAGRFCNQVEQNSYLDGKTHTLYQGVLPARDSLRLMMQSRVGLAVLKPTLSYKESMPTKIFEYLACGTPVIASNFGYWKQLFGTKCCIFVEPFNIKQISKAEKYLIENPDIAQEMGETGRKMVREKFIFEKEKAKLVSAYHKLSKLSNWEKQKEG